MSLRLLAILAAVLGVALDGASALAQTATAPTATARFWKGNTHTHTLNSDGDSSPGEVAHWYRDHGYDFLSLTDHDHLTRTDELQRELDREAARDPAVRRCLLLPGVEVTDELGEAALHVNGLFVSRTVEKQGGESKRAVLQRCIDAIRGAGGVPSLDHPNYTWSLGADDIAALSGLRHMEIFNGHPGTHSFGGGGSPGVEETWDALLTRGARIHAMAVDDSHDFRNFGSRRCNPGKGWIMVRASELTLPAIRAAIEAGDFYASSGVTLADVTRTAGAVRVRIAPETEEATRYTTFFVGAGGKVLARETALESSYTLRPEDAYVRVRVESSIREYAWTQAFFARPEAEGKRPEGETGRAGGEGKR